MLYEIYMHLISLCRTLNTSQHHIDISFEEPQATNDDYKLKYNELISKNALTRIEDSKKVLEKLKEAKNFQKIENLQDWVLEKWNATIDECEKLRQQLTLANQELDQQVKKDSSAYLEKAKDDFQNYKQDLEKQNKEILNCHARNSGLINELEFLKQEKYDMEKIMYQKVAKAESEMNELRDCFFDLFSQVNKNTKKSFSSDEMRNEIFSFINQIERKDKEIERTLSENNSLAQIAEKYVQDLEKMLKENNSLVQVNEKYAKEIARLNEECEYLERNLRDSSEVVKENLLLRNKFSELIDEKEYLENKLNYIQNELLPTSMHEDKTIREALENELLGKCELVKQLAEEIEKFKKFIKLRECEYQELLTLKDEEILRMRLRSS
jgi:chromosome segregation ATPase